MTATREDRTLPQREWNDGCHPLGVTRDKGVPRMQKLTSSSAEKPELSQALPRGLRAELSFSETVWPSGKALGW